MKKIIKIIKSESQENRFTFAFSLALIVLILVKYFATGCVVLCGDWYDG